MSLDLFVEKWCSPHYPPVPVKEDDLATAEARLNVPFPADYRRAVLQIGLPRTTSGLLEAIVAQDSELDSLGDFFSPSEIIEQTLAWHEIGMPRELVAFASDGCGNHFCFDANRLRARTGDGDAIWFYDHDFSIVRQIAPNFDAWIESFCAIDCAP